MSRFKPINFFQDIGLKLDYFCKKYKFFKCLELRPQTHETVLLCITVEKAQNTCVLQF